VPHSQIGPIAVHFPEKVETNEELQALNPDWDLDLLASKTGIYSRTLAADGETASDLAVKACERLFAENNIDPASIDYLLYCTQTPDYILPTTACLIQDRIGLRTSCGAIDYNLGCSGFVYGMSLAEGLIASGQCRRILLVTAETYSKYILPNDRSTRPIFSDAAAATLIEIGPERSVFGFEFGTDGSGADTLFVEDGGARQAPCAIRPRNRKRWKSRLYMDGPSLMSFTVGAIPQMVREMIRKANLTEENIDYYLMHQATLKMLEQLQIALKSNDEQLPIRLANRGNTVSCTLPILIYDLRQEGKLVPGDISTLVGFGVGWSWAGCLWRC
jgi:3-oxoacyl-[acyl-carrier-protein] synthase-3